MRNSELIAKCSNKERREFNRKWYSRKLTNTNKKEKNWYSKSSYSKSAINQYSNYTFNSIWILNFKL